MSYEIDLTISKIIKIFNEYVERAWKCMFMNDPIRNIDGLISSAHTYLKCAHVILQEFPGIVHFVDQSIIDKLRTLANLDIRSTRFSKCEVDIYVLNKKLDKIRRISKIILNRIEYAKKKIKTKNHKIHN